MTTQANVDLRDAITSFNQSPYSPFKIDPNTANFGKLTCRLTDVVWSNNTFDADFGGQSKRVEVNTSKDTVTTVSPSPDETPTSTLTVKTGVVKEFRSLKMPASLPMPDRFAKVNIAIDLTQKDHDLKLSENARDRRQLRFSRSGAASITSKSSVYQGSFEATATLKGSLTFRTLDGGLHEAPIGEIARCASKPFSFKDNALCWKVNGVADLLLETVSVVKAN